MSQIILIEENNALLDLLNLNLTTYTGSEVIIRNNADEAIELLKILPSINLIITTDKVGDEETAKKLYQFVKEEEVDSILLVFGKAPKYEEGDLVNIADKSKWENVVKASAKLLGVSPEALEKKIKPDYIPISVKYFYSIESTPCDIFIRIKKSATDFQFVKRIHSGDTFDNAAIKKYEDQGLKQFYVPKDMEKNFTNFVSNHLVSKLEDPNLSEEEKIDLMGESYEIATREILKLGFNSATIQLTESIINGMVETVEKMPGMNTLLLKIVNSKTTYLYQHAHMTCAVASDCINQLNLKDKNAFKQIAFAAFFQNITLIDLDKYARIHSFRAFEDAALEGEEFDTVFNHALDASRLIQQYNDAPLGVDEIIKHHHGASNGKGFSNAHIEELPGLSRIFLIASDFVHMFLQYKEEGGEPVPIIDKLHNKYPDEKAQSVLKTLEKTLNKKK